MNGQIFKPKFEKHAEVRPFINGTFPNAVSKHKLERASTTSPGFSQSTYHQISDDGDLEHPENSSSGKQPVAIVGISCHFPGEINSPQEFSDFCAKGEEAWSEFPQDRFNIDAWYHPNTDKGGSFNLRSGHFLKDDRYKRFDTGFFNISPKEAKSLDPRSRMHLESAYEAFENAGIPLSEINGSQTGVFVGAFLNDYGSLMDKDPAVNVAHRATGLGIAMLANRLSYWFGLHGPSMTIDTACSASAAAVHLAFESLQTGMSKLALVSGANLVLSPESIIQLSVMKFLSPDGKSYMFDSRANGYARGEGIGTLILKPLSDALANNDTVYAVIRNTGINQDGKTPGITLPSQEAQKRLIQRTYEEIGLNPIDTDLLEAHGTGTVAGDKAEAEALAFGLKTTLRAADKPLNVISVKTKIGHCEAASGVAGVIHGIVALRSRTVFPNCNFENPSSEINFKDWKIQVPTSSQPWISEQPRRVSVNSYGYGGTNVHLILEEHHRHSAHSARAFLNGTAEDQSIPARSKALCISAHEVDSLQTLITQVAHFLETHQDQQTFLDAVYTLGQRRSLLRYRIAIHGVSKEDFTNQLSVLRPKPTRVSRSPKIGFVFTGQGAQWAQMGCQLIQSYPIFSDTLREAETHLRSLGADWSLIEELDKAASVSNIDEPYLSQTLSTALQLALVELLRSWKIEPISVTGHSSGEIAAAFAAGMLSSSTAMTIAYFRGKLCDELAKDKSKAWNGAMLAVGLTEEQIKPFRAPLHEAGVSIACFNSPKSLTLSGKASTIDSFHEKMSHLGHFSRKLKVNVGYHSAQMEIIADQYRRILSSHVEHFSARKDVKFNSSVYPGIRVETNYEYWVQNMICPVRFSDALDHMISEENVAFKPDVLLEIGPHSTLAGPIRQILAKKGAETSINYFATLQRGSDDQQALLSTACNLFNLGAKLDFGAVNFPHGTASTSVLTDLPSYPWNHDTVHWHDGRNSLNYLHQEFPSHDLLGKLTHDSSMTEMKWVNFLSLSFVPWLRDHIVLGEVVFPGAGYMAMAIEAARQKAIMRKAAITGVSLRDVSFKNALPIPTIAPGVEIALLLEPLRYGPTRTTDTWDVFRIVSYSSGRNAVEHCHGMVSCCRGFENDDWDYDDDSIGCYKDGALKENSDWVDWLPTIYSGLQMGPCFRLFTGALRSNEKLITSIQVPDTVSLMPMNYESPSIASAPVVDALLQQCCLHAEDIGDVSGEMYPTYVKDFSFSLNFRKKAGELLWARSHTKMHSQRDMEGSCIAMALNEAGKLIPMAKMTGTRFFITKRQASTVESSYDPNLCTKVVWAPDVEYFGQTDAESLWGHGHMGPEEESNLLYIEKVVWFCIRKAWESKARWDDHLPKHLQHYTKWLGAKYDDGKYGKLGFQTLEWDVADDRVIEETLDVASSMGPYGEMIVKIGRKLPEVLSQAIDPLSLMLEDGLLDKFYASFLNQERANEKAGQYLDILGHKFPGQKILEIGAGTGAATAWILKAIGGRDIHQPRFSSYTFTDISAGFFEKARAKFENHSDLMEFKTLNIENDPRSQGFTGQYDVVVAANVLHATARMERTLQHVNMLLRPGGKLILVELTNHTAVGPALVFGTLPGWWLGADEGRTETPLLTESAWSALLQKVGFSGLDICLRDSEDERTYAISMMISTKQDQAAQSEQIAPHILYTDPSQENFCLTLQTLLGQHSKEKGNLSLLQDAALSSGIYVLIDSLDKPLLGCLNEHQFLRLQELFESATGLLWVGFGETAGSSNPTTGSVTGFLRSLRSENEGMSYVVLDLDGRSQTGQDTQLDIIARMFHSRFSNPADSSEFEYASHNGFIKIPRMVEDEMANKNIRPLLTAETELQPLWLKDGHRVLQMRQIGFLDSFYFAAQPHTKLSDDEVEICVKSAGLNFKDVLIASGALPVPLNLGLECAGTIARVGGKVVGLEVGDRVCASGMSTFATHARVPSRYTVKIPQTMDFSVAASIPTVFTTAYYCIYVAGALKPGEVVLIHSATGGLGQACVKMAQNIGAEIIATCGSSEKVKFLQTTYGLPRDHILNSRSYRYESQVMRITKNRGVDVLINDQAGDGLREGWACMGMFGRFIDVAKRDSIENASLPMAQFGKGVTYLPVPLDLYMDHQQESMAHALQGGTALIFEGKMTPIQPITTFKMSEVEKAFRFMQSGKHIGKIVLNLDDDDQVQAIPGPKPGLRLRPQATYMIVGGLSGIGSAFAQRMVEKLGATHLILLSRSGMNAEGAQDLVHSIEEKGANVKVIKCDVASAEDLNLQLDACTKHLPPVRGVIQGAMVLQDSILATQTHSKFIAARRPKIEGTLNLHNYFNSRSISLDFFVMLSSVAGIQGGPSQSNYAAGNTFQDAFAHWRRAQGLPALAIDIGYVADVGWTASNSNLRRVAEERRQKPITSQELMTLIEYHVMSWFENIRRGESDNVTTPSAQVAVGLSENLPESALFSHIKASRARASPAASSTTQSAKQDSVKVKLDAVGNDKIALSDIIETVIGDKLAQLLLLARENVHLDDTFASHGVDSLVAVEIRSWVGKELGGKLVVSEILTGQTTIRDVVKEIVEKRVAA